jgi:hypothetical protein
MARTFKGYAFIQGVTETGCVVDIGAYVHCFIDSAPVSRRCTTAQHIGADGDICAMVYSNEYLEMAVSVRPASNTTIADLKTRLIFLTPGSNVAMNGFQQISYGIYNDVLNQIWIVGGDQTITLNADSPATVDMTLNHFLAKHAEMQHTVS